MKKRILALALASAMVLSMAACGGETNTTTTPNTPNSTTSQTTTDNKAPVSSVKTLHDSISISPKKWSPHEWETDDESYILNRTTTGLYAFAVNDDKTNYEAIPAAAAEFPVDVTGEYAGKYNVPADAKEGWAFKIALNKDMKWEDGTPINADTYIYSFKQLLNPKIKNYRANSYYQGSLVLANAEAYYKQGKSYNNANDGKVSDDKMLVTFTKPCAFFGEPAANFYNTPDYKENFIVDGVDLFEKYSKQDYIPLTDEIKADLVKLGANFGTADAEKDYVEFCVYEVENVPVDFDKEVGMVKTGDYEITIILDKPITNFYLLYNLGSGVLVKEDLYEANMEQKGDIMKTTYGTKDSNYASYGPFKLTKFQADKLIVLDKNENWFGWNNPKLAESYDRIECQIIPEQKTQLLEFLKGNIDSVGLTTTDMEIYKTSDYLQLTPQSFTSKITFNSNKTALKKRESAGINKSILSYRDFRKAMSRAIDRAEFCATCTAAADPGFGLNNYLYVSDPENGTLYRETEPAIQALLNVYDAKSLDEMTGYNPDEAKELINKAYADALAAGDIKDTDKVELELAVYMLDETSQKIVDFIDTSLAKAAVGTPLEGRTKIKAVVDQDYYNSAKAGRYDLIISTWGGAAMDPFGTSEVYCRPEVKHEYGFDPMTEKTTITVNGKQIEKTFYDWYDALCNGEYAAADVDTRTVIWAGIEEGILETYNTAPLYYRTSGSLLSHRTAMETEDFLAVVAFGRVEVNKSDAEWAEYCKAQNYELKY